MRLGILESVLKKMGFAFVNEWVKREYQEQKFRWMNERPIEFRFVLQNLAKMCPVTVLDVGTGTTALPHIMSNCGFVVTAIDNITDYWPKGMVNRHFYVINDDILDPKINRKFDFITCISVLEHIEYHNDALKGMIHLLKEGGHLAITFPYNENRYVENVYKLPDSSYGQDEQYICKIFSRKEVEKWLQENDCEIVDQEYWEVFDGSLWTFGKRLIPPVQVDKDQKHHLTCILIMKRVQDD